MAAKPETLFIRACSTGKAETVRQLIQSGPSPDTRDTYGLTGLIWAGRRGQIEVARVLVEAGAELDGKDRTGRTALSHSVMFKRLAFVQFMASNAAFLNPVDMHGWTPLDLASIPKDARMVEILKQLGAQGKSTQEPPPEDETHTNRTRSMGVPGSAVLIFLLRSNESTYNLALECAVGRETIRTPSRHLGSFCLWTAQLSAIRRR